MRKIFGSLVLVLSVLVMIVSWLFDAEGARIVWATLAMAAIMITVGVVLDGAAKRDAEVR